MFKRFLAWYERYRVLAIGITAGLFILQIIHLLWLAIDVIIPTLFHTDSILNSEVFITILTLVDYTEIPALLAATILYLSEFIRGDQRKSAIYLLLVNSQWLHLFWITDEFIIEQFSGMNRTTILPVWLAIIAILIDYLEVPVIIDTIRRFSGSLRKRTLSTISK